MTVSNRRRKIIYTGIIGIVLVAFLAVSITYAYLQSRTDKVTNTFTLGEGVKVELEHESEVEENFTPGMEYDKPAKVVIPNDAMPLEYIAVKIEFFAEIQGTDGNLTLQKIDNTEFLSTYAHLQSYNVLGDVIDTTNATKQTGTRNGWVTDDNEVFYYGAKVSDENGNPAVQLTTVSSGASITVFDQIKVNDPYNHVYKMTESGTTQQVTLAVNEEDKYIVSGVTARVIEKGQLVTFHTIVSAYAVQGDVSSAQAMAEFDYMLAETGTS